MFVSGARLCRKPAAAARPTGRSYEAEITGNVSVLRLVLRTHSRSGAVPGFA